MPDKLIHSACESQVTTNVETPTHAPPTPASTANRYILGKEIARGGMGEVYRATDTLLDREVAIKVLQAKYPLTSGTALRFHDEARITAQLQHPGIPPVHDLGILPDGRPFLAMKLIKGETLDEMLKNRPNPSHDHGRFVAAFEQIAQALAYAHAHNVIHRDLKPQNVMVGNYGEVQAMDWGLAKILGSHAFSSGDPDSTAAATEIQSLRDSEELLTQAGSVLGTPSYMPPEQAIGAIDQIDARSDVFGLGGILAVILTGRPPFLGETGESTRQLAARGRVQDCFARLDACEADPEIVSLCKKCLAPEKADRPADAGFVAKAVATLRIAADERARQAEMESERATMRETEGRKRRRVLAWSAAVVSAVLSAGVAVAAVLAVRATNAEKATSDQLAKTEEARLEAEANNRRALQAADLMAGQLGTSLKPIAGSRSNVVVEALDKARTVYDELVAGPSPPIQALHGKAKLLLECSALYRLTRRTAKAKEAATEAIALYDRLIALTSDEETRDKYQRGRGVARHNLAHVLTDQRYSKESVAAFRCSISDFEAAHTSRFPDFAASTFAASFTIIGNILTSQGDYEGAREAHQAALTIRRSALAQSPSDKGIEGALAISLERYGQLVAEAGDQAEGARLLREARAIQEAQLMAAPSPGKATLVIRVLNTLAQITSDPAETKECVATAQEILRKYPNQDTDDTNILRQQLRTEFVKTEVARKDANDLDAKRVALAAQFESLTKLRESCVDIIRDDPDNFEALTDIANFDTRRAQVLLKLAELGDNPDDRRQAARTLLTSSVADYGKILERDPNDLDSSIGLIFALYQFSKVETNPAAAFARKFEMHKTELECYFRLLNQYPSTKKWKNELRRSLLSLTLSNTDWPTAAKEPRVVAPLMALAQVLADGPQGAMEETWATIETARLLVANYLADVDANGLLPADGKSLRAKFPKPIVAVKDELEFYATGLVTLQRFAEADPKNTEAQRDLCSRHEKLGGLNLHLGHTKEALDCYQKSLVLRQKLANAMPLDKLIVGELISTHTLIAVVFQQELDYAKAIESFETAEKLAIGMHENALLVVRQNLTFLRNAEKAIDDLDFALKQPAAEVSGLLSVRLQAFAKKYDLKNLLATAEAFEKLAESDKTLCYNTACAWSLSSGLAKDDPKLREQCALKAMTMLRNSPTGNDMSFATPAALAAHIEKDTDMNPLREREDFKKFLAELQ